MARFYGKNEVDRGVMANKVIGLLGYGNQGRVQAINLRKAGYSVIIGNHKDESFEMAESDGFAVSDIRNVAGNADILMILLPDEVAPLVYQRDILPALAPGKALEFASGYNITYKYIEPPRDVDVIMVAPRMIGQGIMDLTNKGVGFPVLLGVEQDFTGNATGIALAIADGIGAFLPGGAVLSSSCQEETLIDLFSEHTWAGAMLFILRQAYYVLTEAGASPEATLLELYASGEIGEIGRAMANKGLWKQLKLHSHTSQFGQLLHGPKFAGDEVRALMEQAVNEIKDGTFAKLWHDEQERGLLKFHDMLDEVAADPMNKVEDYLFRILNRE